MRHRKKSTSLTLDIWPGFVDALATLLMVLVFMIMLFVVYQFVLTEILRDREQDLDHSRSKASSLSSLLESEKSTSQHLKKLLKDKEDNLIMALKNLDLSTNELTKNKQYRAATEQQIETLSQELETFNQQIARITQALEISEQAVTQQKSHIKHLNTKLNEALVSKVEEMAKYRSEFFGMLRDTLGNHPDIRIVGDRFIFQSEVLFESGSADVTPTGYKQLAKVAQIIQEISQKIPSSLNWMIRVDGHTDYRPIHNNTFRSNWELSFARALSVVTFFIKNDIPAKRLAPTGFGEQQPITTGKSAEQLRKNRRIELKFDQR